MAQPERAGRATSHGAPDRTMPQGSKWKMGHPNMHKGPGWSQLSKADTGALKQNNLTRTCPIGPLHMARHNAPDRMMPQGRKWKTGFPKVHKVPGSDNLA